MKRLRLRVASQLQAIRLSLGIQQKELAQRLGKSRNVLGGWERGRQVPTLKHLNEWAQALGCKLSITIAPTEQDYGIGYDEHGPAFPIELPTPSVARAFDEG